MTGVAKEKQRLRRTFVAGDGDMYQGLVSILVLIRKVVSPGKYHASPIAT